MRLYHELADWWPLLSDPAEYEAEAATYLNAMVSSAGLPIGEVLELGSGGGNNASHMKSRARLTLTDLSPEMLAVSRRVNPECEHVQGDMRTLRLGRAFDAVFVHDAVMHMRTREELAAVAATARAHCRSGGAVLFVPDAVKETFAPQTTHGGHDAADGSRGLRYMDWSMDPDPADEEALSTMVYILRQGGSIRVEHETQCTGLFAERTWLDVLAAADLGHARRLDFPFGNVGFVCSRP